MSDTIAYETSPDEVLAEIKASISKRNPNIGAIQSVFLKEGPRAYKSATTYEILNAETSEHHHLALCLMSFTRFKKDGYWKKQDEHNISLDTDGSDEIGLLQEFIHNFKNTINDNPQKYGVIKEEDFNKLESINKPTTQDSVDTILEDQESLNILLETGGTHLFNDSLKWVPENENAEKLIEKFQSLNVSSLSDITTIIGIANLKQVEKIWEGNTSNSDEEFWQNTLSEYSSCVSQIFSCPIILFKEKAFVGGKSVNNKKGNIVDYIFKNDLSDNVVLIEIKTPTTNLLGKEYRQTFSISSDLSGSINQALKYKDKFQKNYNSLTSEAEEADKHHLFNPRTYVIAGNYKSEIDSLQKKEAFELFRSNLKDVEIITYDELFSKTSNLIKTLEGS